jgi:amino acid transporter
LLWRTSGGVRALESRPLRLEAHAPTDKAMKLQGLSRDELPFKSWTQPFGAWVVLVSFLVIIFFNGMSLYPYSPAWLLMFPAGYTTFMTKPFDFKSFISDYINIPFTVILYFGYKIG